MRALLLARDPTGSRMDGEELHPVPERLFITADDANRRVFPPYAGA